LRNRILHNAWLSLIDQHFLLHYLLDHALNRGHERLGSAVNRKLRAVTKSERNFVPTEKRRIERNVNCLALTLGLNQVRNPN
jgi:hypothetical protein